MAKYEQINKAVGRVGAMLRRARRVCNISMDDAAALLHVTPNELFEYEHGITEIPLEILESMFALGYKMKQVRVLERRYDVQRNLFRKIKQTVETAG